MDEYHVQREDLFIEESDFTVSVPKFSIQFENIKNDLPKSNTILVSINNNITLRVLF